jgi:hypothetical protein
MQSRAENLDITILPDNKSKYFLIMRQGKIYYYAVYKRRTVHIETVLLKALLIIVVNR